jgi:hypothetical protein
VGRAHGTATHTKSEAIAPRFGILEGRGDRALSRTLNDDFDEDDLPSGPLDLEKGSSGVGTGVASSYADSSQGGIDFDDELYGEQGNGAALELDVPNKHGSHPGSVSNSPGRAPPVPDLALDAPPASRSSGRALQAPQAPHSSGSLPAQPQSADGARGRSGQHPAAQPPPPPGSEGGHHGFAPPAPSSSRGVEDASGPQMAPQPPPPPAKPTAAALIAKYPPPPVKVSQAPMYAVRVVLRQLELRTDLESLRRRRSPDVPLYEAALRAYDKKTFRLGMAINLAALTVATFIFFLPVIIRFMRAD